MTTNDLHIGWFPDWLPQRATQFWRGALRYFAATGTSKPPSYTDIAEAAMLELPGIRVSRATFERARRHYPDLIPRPSTLKRGALPPWVEDPALVEEYRPAGVTLPLPIDADVEKVLLRTDTAEMIGCRNGIVRWRSLTTVAAGYVLLHLCHLHLAVFPFHLHVHA